MFTTADILNKEIFMNSPNVELSDSEKFCNYLDLVKRQKTHYLPTFIGNVHIFPWRLSGVDFI